MLHENPWTSSPDTNLALVEQHHQNPDQGNNQNAWTAPPAMDLETATVSPKMLRIRQSPSLQHVSSSESLHSAFFNTGGNPGGYEEQPPVAAPPSPAEHTSRAHRPQPSPRTKSSKRRQLPDKPSRPLKFLPILPSSEKQKKHNTSHSDSDLKSRKIPKTRGSSATPSSFSSSSSSHFGDTDAGLSGTDDRSAKDDFLVRSKQAGMTYKEIRRRGRFSEAESTLRGRFRTLTKAKEERVRKPEWSTADLRLLEMGVRILARSSPGSSSSSYDLNSAKIPWKKVAEYIADNGGSYRFGNSTCRKRWDELVRTETARGKDVNRPFYEQYPSNSGHPGHGADTFGEV
ncbi:hypothetical protein QBC46DRAFT_263540 [Diplogelasinospora grovesii]|uniref:Myb-like domain-containing protein n=1 Tax=Diplogelasinospora grovesii TaxID=303347 RepID=A0AAN6S3P7_9PEZI|nr:hypothetical protein QBC46DRAFT_263540 [Diplogelasinospora grovesii]